MKRRGPDGSLSRRLCRALVTLLALGPWGAASAWMFAPPADGRVAADLHLVREEARLEKARGDGADAGESRVSRIGIRYAEGFGESVILALSGGYAAATRSEDRLAAGMRFTGSYAALDFRGERRLSPRLRLVLDLHLSGAWLRDEREGSKVRHDRVQGEASAGVLLWLRPHLLIYGGPSLTALRIDEQWRGEVNAAPEFDSRKSAGWRAGAAFELDEGGWIALEARDGAVRGFQLSLLRRFQGI